MRHQISFLLLLAILSSMAIPTAAAQTDDRRAEQRLLERLRSQTVSLDFKETPVEEAIGFLATYTRVNIIVDPVVFRTLSPEERAVTLKVKDLSALNALRLILDLQGLAIRTRKGVLIVTTRERKLANATLIVYDIRDLTLNLQDFPGGRVGLGSSEGDSDPGIRFFEEVPEKAQTPETIADLLRENTGQKTWEKNEVSIAQIGGLLMVRQYAPVHAEIRRFLDRLRARK